MGFGVMRIDFNGTAEGLLGLRNPVRLYQEHTIVVIGVGSVRIERHRLLELSLGFLGLPEPSVKNNQVDVCLDVARV